MITTIWQLNPLDDPETNYRHLSRNGTTRNVLKWKTGKLVVEVTWRVAWTDQAQDCRRVPGYEEAWYSCWIENEKKRSGSFGSRSSAFYYRWHLGLQLLCGDEGKELFKVSPSYEDQTKDLFTFGLGYEPFVQEPDDIEAGSNTVRHQSSGTPGKRPRTTNSSFFFTNSTFKTCMTNLKIVAMLSFLSCSMGTCLTILRLCPPKPGFEGCLEDWCYVYG